MDEAKAERPSGRESSRTTGDPSARTPHPLASRVHDLVGVVKSLGDEPSARAVHELRTTIRRVETLLAAADQTTGVARKVGKQLDRIRKRAGKVRDVDVHLKALRSVPRATAPAAIAEVRTALQKARDKRERQLARAVGDERDRGLVKRLRRVITRTIALPHSHADAVTAVVGVVGELGALVRSARPLGAANLHGLRIDVKRLRYRAEPFLPDPSADHVVHELKRVQDAIGTWHDWATLEETAVDVLGEGENPLVGAVRARTERELAKAVRVTERVAARLEKLGRAVESVPASTGGRKGQRAMTAGAVVPPSCAGASA